MFAPTYSRATKAACEQYYATLAPSPPEPPAAPPPPPDKRQLLVFSITVINLGDDLPLAAWEALGSWLSGNTITGAFGFEKGETEHQLHSQGSVKCVVHQ